MGLTFFHFSEEEQSGGGVAYIDFREHFWMENFASKVF